MTDLSLIPEDEIWEELCRRNSACILVTLKEYDGIREAVQVNFFGGKFTCIGLAEHLLNKIMEEAMNPDDDAIGDS